MHSFLNTYFLLVVLAGVPGIVGAANELEQRQAAPETSSQIIAGITAEAIVVGVYGATDTIHPPKEQPVFLNMDAPASVRSRLISALLDAGVRLASEREGQHVLNVEWNTHNRLVAHWRNSSSRELTGTVFVTWADESAEIRNTWDFSFEFFDVVQADAVGALQGIDSDGWEPARFHSREPSTGRRLMRRVAEPALITGAVVVTVYLLYNVRR